MRDRYKAFPPGWSNIRVPVHAKGATLAGIATYTPCAPKGVWGQRLAWGLVKAGGARLLPGKYGSWQPPMPAEHWSAMLAELTAIAGAFDSHTVYERRRLRPGLMMVLLDGERPVGFVKARAEPASGIIREEEALGLIEADPPPDFHAPRVLGSGEVPGWRFLVTSPMPPRMHRMLATMPPPEIPAAIGSVLAPLARPGDVPGHWTASHRDFTPWNLRRFGDDRVPWLIDWEEAGYAPPGADEVLYLASAYGVGVELAPVPLPASEAVAYWWAEIDRRAREKLDWGLELRALDYGMLEALAAGAKEQP